MTKNVVAYYRTSSATNVGEDKDSRKRQEDACKGYAASHGYVVHREFYDPAVKGSDHVMDRPGFAALLEYMIANDISIILIETANRFARDIMVQITGHEYLIKNGIELIPVDCPQHFTDENPTAEMVRNLLAVVSQFEKKSLVEKLRKARERKRRENGRCEGRKPALPEAIKIAKELRDKGNSLRAISKELKQMGFTVMERNKEDGKYYPTGRIYYANSVRCMIRDGGKHVQSN